MSITNHSGYIAGAGSLSSEVSLGTTYTISGYVAPTAAITSSSEYTEGVQISGIVSGRGAISSFINISRSKASWPFLRVEDTYKFNECPMAAFDLVGFTPNNILNVISYEDDIYENSADYYIIETVTQSGSYFTPIHYPLISGSYDKVNYLVTNIKSNNQNGKPLFYQYELLYDVSGSHSKDIITIYRNNDTLLSKRDYVVQSSYDLLSDGSSRYSHTSWGTINSSKNLHRIRVLLPLDTYNKDDFYTIKYTKSIYGSKTPQEELIELEPLYIQGEDFDVCESGLYLTDGTIISDTTTTLWVIKDPDDRILPIGVEPPSRQSDEISSWRFRLNTGNITMASGEFSGQEERLYYLDNYYWDTPIAITNTKPLEIFDNIVKVRENPLYIDDSKYKYPNYTIELFDESAMELSSEEGKISVKVNGLLRDDIKVKAVDRHKGFLLFNKTIPTTDDVEINFYADSNKYLLLENLELNPKVTDSDPMFHISGYIDGLGIALRPYDPLDSGTLYPYIYDSSITEASRTCHMIPPIGDSTSGVLWSSGDFVSLCELGVNRLTKDIVRITDARRTAGGLINGEILDDWFNDYSGILTLREKDWYAGNSRYGGKPLGHGGLTIINVPSGLFYNERDRWIDSYAEKMDARTAEAKGTKEFNFYMDQVIKQYIPAGSIYVLIPVDSDGNLGRVIDMESD